jgi:hypothetical protein
MYEKEPFVNVGKIYMYHVLCAGTMRTALQVLSWPISLKEREYVSRS